jgi:hypothetical protein
MNSSKPMPFSDVVTFVISLESFTRNIDLPDQLRRQSIPFQIIKAVDGRKWTAPFDSHLTDVNCFKSVLGREPRGPEIGCALSHIKCMNKARQDNADYAIVFEDDANVVGDLSAIMTAIKSLDDGSPAVFQLHSYSDSMINRKTVREIDENRSQVVGNFFKPPRSTAAYCINRSAIDIYSQHQTVLGVADWPPFAHAFRFWGFFPCPVMLSELPSTIETSTAGVEVNQRKKIFVIIKDYLRLYKRSSFREFGGRLGGTKPYLRYVILPNTIYLLRYHRTKYHGNPPHTYRTR